MGGNKDKKHWAWRGEIGPSLEEARESRGLSLKEAERATSIRWRYLESLEREEPSELPARGYVQSFLRSYAEFLDLDAEELSGRLKKHDGVKQRIHHPVHGRTGDSADKSAPEAHDSRPRKQEKRRRRGVLAMLSATGLVLVLVVAALYMLWDSPVLSGSPSEGEPAGDEPAVGGQNDPSRGGPAPTLEDGESGGGETESGEPGGEERLRAVVRVQGSESWISVETESGMEYTDIAQPGFSQSFESGESLRITTGNAGAVELRINGIDYGSLGSSGEVTSKSFTLKRAR